MTESRSTRSSPDGHEARVFAHAPEVWDAVPSLRAVAAVLPVPVAPEEQQRLGAAAEAHLRAIETGGDRGPESSVRSVMAWRRVFADLGVRPTQYRCAAESLLRRLRTRGDLPRVHPLVDLGNALSVRWAVPVAVVDLDRVEGSLLVRRAIGDEVHDTFGGDVEHPAPGEMVYADGASHAHSRRWCWRQSARSTVRPSTRTALVVAEAVHEGGQADLDALAAALEAAVAAAGVTVAPTLLTAEQPALRLPPRERPVTSGSGA
ncbi:B3/B4 domain-containing protein [Pseudokineococcus sp. 1T1Z-3]|uniref:B3/B4 domain-containing protein n=1 Tax=Pseudokineococcus sp. 1T1Z-3 TaxID=3132745 RepID=UPI0030A20953